MARFDFALAGVLRHRERAEQQRAAEHARALSALASIESDLRAIADELRTTADDFKQSGGLVGRIDPQRLIAQRRFGTAKRQQGEALVSRLVEAKRSAESARAALAHAARERRAIELLRDKALARWRADEAAREQADTDEVGQQIGHADLSGD